MHKISYKTNPDNKSSTFLNCKDNKIFTIIKAMVFVIKTKTPDGQIFKFTKYNPLKQSISRDETTTIEDPEERKSRLRALKDKNLTEPREPNVRR